ncbi:MAG: M24 family metallopeptidase, partial [Sphingomonas sp.]|uniref:M24 family metallopeptidase n=1 Tax=Sphingomonas sp. TaxID=28214 RepID=UPI003F7E7DFD
RLARIAMAQDQMQQLDYGAIVIEPGASMVYFAGIEFYRSERPTCLVLTADGEMAVVTPAFEEATLRETLAIPADIRAWRENENAMALVAGWLRDRGLGSAVIGFEETTRLFIVDGLARALPSADIRNGAEITRRCRQIKSPAELALMHHANQITIAAYREVIPRIAVGMRPADIKAMMKAAHESRGAPSFFEDALIGEAAAYPHGSSQPQIVEPGALILMDCGCSVAGYKSDISRTFVFGEANERQRQVWNQAKEGQRLAFERAQVGVAAGDVDAAPRRYYEALGYGANYVAPGLTHRTGHGIGLDLHEPFNLVEGEASLLAAGMCFSNEPGIYIPGEFGVRTEDCFYMTEDGPRWFSEPARSIDEPV